MDLVKGRLLQGRGEKGREKMRNEQSLKRGGGGGRGRGQGEGRGGGRRQERKRSAH